MFKQLIKKYNYRWNNSTFFKLNLILIYLLIQYEKSEIREQ